MGKVAIGLQQSSDVEMSTNRKTSTASSEDTANQHPNFVSTYLLNEVGSIYILITQTATTDQLHQHRLESCYKCEVSSPHP